VSLDSADDLIHGHVPFCTLGRGAATIRTSPNRDKVGCRGRVPDFGQIRFDCLPTADPNRPGVKVDCTLQIILSNPASCLREASVYFWARSALEDRDLRLAPSVRLTIPPTINSNFEIEFLTCPFALV
jgi:hypothetical protein